MSMTIPCVEQYGCNPTGVTTTEERRRDILAFAVKHSFLIFEGQYTFFIYISYNILTSIFQDDPCYFLYYGTRPRPTSYYALELVQPEVGRVIRFDSFSKVFSAGMRIDFISGPVPLLDAIDKHVR